jgi:hypothetical protein
LDRVVESASRVLDLDRRLELYSEAEALRRRDIPTLYLTYPDKGAFVAPDVLGFNISPTWAVKLKDIRREGSLVK